MGLFSRRDWNIVALTYETRERFRLNANRKQGQKAVQAKKGASIHQGTICWMVFDQEGKSLEQGLGPAATRLTKHDADKLLAGFPTNRDVLDVLRRLEDGREMATKIFEFRGASASSDDLE